MFSKIYDALVLAGTPSRWPTPLRRLFVLLCPVTVPLLILLWVLLLAAFIGVLITGMVWVILMEFINSMRNLWDGPRYG